MTPDQRLYLLVRSFAHAWPEWTWQINRDNQMAGWTIKVTAGDIKAYHLIGDEVLFNAIEPDAPVMFAFQDLVLYVLRQRVERAKKIAEMATAPMVIIDSVGASIDEVVVPSAWLSKVPIPGPLGDFSVTPDGTVVLPDPSGDQHPLAHHPVLHDLLGLQPNLRTPVKYPCKHGPSKERPLYEVVIHLNDACKWTREAIADWLEGLPLDLALNNPAAVGR